MPVIMREGRARMIASEVPLTWRQVVLLAHQYSEEHPHWQPAHWLIWGPIIEVGEALWQYWTEHATQPDEPIAGDGEAEGDLPHSAGVGATIRAQIVAADLPLWAGSSSPTIARSVGQRRTPSR